MKSQQKVSYFSFKHHIQRQEVMDTITVHKFHLSGCLLLTAYMVGDVHAHTTRIYLDDAQK